MSNEYQLADGSPRYGHRTESPAGEHPAPATAAAPDAAEGAVQLSLDALAAAIDRRLTSAWADVPDPAVQSLREHHPEELRAARALVKLHLGSQRQWRLKAQAVRDKRLTGPMARPGASARSRQVLALRWMLIAALIAPPAFVVATNPDNILKLLTVGVICVVAALAGGHILTLQARVPVMPIIRGPWLKELREDIVNATLVAILQNKGVAVDPLTAAAARRGWESIHVAARSVELLHS
ncbi:hypothetical protein [Arthrobacter sp. C152]